MLTDSEKRWLELREVSETDWSLYSCIECKWFKRHQGSTLYPCCFSKLFKSCPRMNPDKADFTDALEFSERVAAKLAADENCGVDEDCPPDMSVGWGRLKAARLAVEEELIGTD